MPQSRTDLKSPTLTWVDFTDFTPGVYNNSNISGVNNYSSGINPIVPAPKAAAQLTGTWGCMALPTGGLAPLPRIITVKTFIAAGDESIYYSCTGMISYSPSNLSIITTPLKNNFIYCLMSIGKTDEDYYINYKIWLTLGKTGKTHTTRLWQWAEFIGSPLTKGLGAWGCPFPITTRINYSGILFPVVVFPMLPTYTNTVPNGEILVYPPLEFRTTYTMQNINTVSTTVTPNPTGCKVGPIIAHQGRIIVLSNSRQEWPTGTIITNDGISFTTPSGTKWLYNQLEYISPENPFGYGGGGSISAGELFLIKKKGGAVVVYGTITNPQVIYLGGVQSTGNIYGQVAQSPIGLVYCSQGNGAWVWNGSSQSTKISYQISSTFFVMTPDATIQEITGVVNTNGSLGYFCFSWGEWILFSNSWIYNIKIKSWWRLTNTTSSSAFFHYCLAGNTLDSVFASRIIHFASGSTVYSDLVLLNKKVPGKKWSWYSLPVKLSENRYINIREVIVYASSPECPYGEIAVEIFPNEGTTPEVLNIVSTIKTYPSMFRIPCNINTTSNIRFRIEAVVGGDHGTTIYSAPIIHQISFGYKVRQHIQNQDS